MSLFNLLQNTAALNREVRDIRASRGLAAKASTQTGKLLGRDRATGKYRVAGEDGGTYLARQLTARGIGVGDRVVLRIGSNGKAFADWL